MIILREWGARAEGQRPYDEGRSRKNIYKRASDFFFFFFLEQERCIVCADLSEQEHPSRGLVRRIREEVSPARNVLDDDSDWPTTTKSCFMGHTEPDFQSSRPNISMYVLRNK